MKTLILPSGGGIAAPNFSTYATPDPTGATLGSSIGPGYMTLVMLQWPGAGTSLNDVGMRISWMLPSICSAMNSKMGITAVPVYVGTGVLGNVVGNWDNAAYTFTANASQLYDKDTFASNLQGTGSGQYCQIWHVIIKR